MGLPIPRSPPLQGLRDIWDNSLTGRSCVLTVAAPMLHLKVMVPLGDLCCPRGRPPGAQPTRHLRIAQPPAVPPSPLAWRGGGHIWGATLPSAPSDAIPTPGPQAPELGVCVQAQWVQGQGQKGAVSRSGFPRRQHSPCWRKAPALSLQSASPLAVPSQPFPDLPWKCCLRASWLWTGKLSPDTESAGSLTLAGRPPPVCEPSHHPDLRLQRRGPRFPWGCLRLGGTEGAAWSLSLGPGATQLSV